MTTRIDPDAFDQLPIADAEETGRRSDRRKGGGDRRAGAMRQRHQLDEAETRLAEAQTHARMIMHVAATTARAATPSEAARGALEAVRNGFGWPYGSYWVMNPRLGRMRFGLESGAVNNEFHRVTVNSSYPDGDGLIGKAWRYRDAFLVDDLQYLNDRRGEVARVAGCTAALALPQIGRAHV